MKVALIENGADTYALDHREWIDRARVMIEATAGEVKTFDLRTYTSASRLESELSDFDVVWIGGGNVYYLRWIMKESGFDKIIRRLCEGGIVYGGDSAGAIIAGPTIDHFQPADSSEDAPSIILEGLNLTNTVIVPHFDHVKYAPLMSSINIELQKHSFHTITINDDEAVIINNQEIKKV